MTVLLDIDGVLLDWSRHGKNQCGFTDWVEPKLQFFSRYSPEQLALIANSFTDIRWLTTWISNNMVNDYWTPNTGFGPYPIAIEPLERSEDGLFNVSPNDHYIDDRFVIERGLSIPLLKANWWKLNAVAALLNHGHLPDKVVWVDDDIPVLKHWIYEILDLFDAREQFRLYAPTQIWSRDDIQEAAEWLK